MRKLSVARTSRASASSTPRKAGPSRKLKTAGSRIGTKFRDMRWMGPDGSVWDSRFEYEVYSGLVKQGLNVRRTTPDDSIPYTHAVRGGLCTVCASNKVVTERSYTPDFFVYTDTALDRNTGSGVDKGYFIEAKGYLRADRRSLLRSLRKARPDIDLRLVAQRDYKVGKSTLTGWASKYLKVPVAVWNGKLPEDWT